MDSEVLKENMRSVQSAIAGVAGFRDSLGRLRQQNVTGDLNIALETAIGSLSDTVQLLRDNESSGQMLIRELKKR